MSITLYITIITVGVSILAMYNHALMDKLIFHPYSVHNNNEWYRFFTCGLVHADFMHLAFNMFSFYMFGDYVEQYFAMIFGRAGSSMYIILYVSSLLVCLIPTYLNHYKQYNYNRHILTPKHIKIHCLSRQTSKNETQITLCNHTINKKTSINNTPYKNKDNIQTYYNI